MERDEKYDKYGQFVEKKRTIFDFQIPGEKELKLYIQDKVIHYYVTHFKELN
jgi:hypothetical protein